MHYLMLVTIQMPLDATSDEVRDTVHQTLSNDDSFCGEGGRFGCPLADWFVIGGRWSGHLAESLIGKQFLEALKARFPDLPIDHHPASLADTHADDFNTIWSGCGGIGPNPYSRCSYEDCGYEDDAMPLTRELYDALLAEYEGSSTDHDGNFCGYADLDSDVLSPDFIGQKWLVVVDYHN